MSERWGTVTMPLSREEAWGAKPESAPLWSTFPQGVGKAAQFTEDQPFRDVSEVLKEVECRFPNHVVQCGRGGVITRS
jgi:hypothetical protein